MAETQILDPDDAGIARAAELVRAGHLVAFPTETVYGLGGDATDATAVARIFEAKGRPHFNPLIAHVVDLAAAEALVELDGPLRALAERFWPGPLTLVAPMRPGAGVAELVTAGLPTLAVRVPAHSLAQALLGAVGRPVAAPSANPSGKISPTTASHVMDGLSGRIAAVLDGGPCPVGLESTIIGAGPDGPKLLRPGGLSTEEIETALGQPLGAAGEDITAPGQLASHYAPNAAVRLNADAPRPGELYLGFGARAGDMTLSATGDLVEAAANLFAALRMLDGHARPIAVAPIPEVGLGRAINDRLRRAAAPR
ncbi:MAG: L-threonylcarbamoyladenylate synthase [Pseudomonadota bacterium]